LPASRRKRQPRRVLFETDVTPKEMHPVVLRAADGDLPGWAVAGRARRAHAERVAAVMDGWAADRGLSTSDRMRWRAAGILHDALRDATGQQLRPLVPERFADLPDRVLHGPAAAQLLKSDGVADKAILRAVRYHTLGHRRLDILGRCLCVADFVEPGRLRQRQWRDSLFNRMPADVDDVVREIFRGRIRLLAQRGDSLASWTVGFWNSLVQDSQR